jgi:hypothetical protein
MPQKHGLLALCNGEPTIPQLHYYHDYSSIRARTVAGSDPKVKALAYVAALQPDVGETSAQVYPPVQPASDHLVQIRDGFVSIGGYRPQDAGRTGFRCKAAKLTFGQMTIAGAVVALNRKGVGVPCLPR